MSEEEKTGDTTETPTPVEEAKTVQDRLDEMEPAEDTSETPEETPVETAEDTTEETEETLEETPKETSEEKKPRTVPVTALQKERQKRREAEAAAKAQEERIAALEAQAKQTQTQQQKLERPQPSQFDTHEEYLNALGEFVDKKAEVVADERVEQRLKAQTEQQQQAEMQRKSEESRNRFRRLMDKAHAEDEAFEDSYEYVNSISLDKPAITEAIVNSEVADKLITYLANKPEEAEKIAGLSDIATIKAIGAIEDKITAPPPKPNKKTEAPKPVKPVGGDAKTGKGLKWREGMTPAEKADFKKTMQEQGLTLLDVM
jgi:hypothetical protein